MENVRIEIEERDGGVGVRLVGCEGMNLEEGVILTPELCDELGLSTIQRYALAVMWFIRENSDEVRHRVRLLTKPAGPRSW